MSGIENKSFEATEDNEKNDQVRSEQINKQNGKTDDILMMPMRITPEEVRNNEEMKRGKNSFLSITMQILTHIVIGVYLAYVTYHYIATRDECNTDCELTLCSPYGMLLFVLGATYLGLLYFRVFKRRYGKLTYDNAIQPLQRKSKEVFKKKSSRLVLVCLIAAAFFVYIIYETYTDLTRLRALLGVAVFVTLGYFLSAHQRKIIWRPVVCGGILQFLLGVLFIRWPVGRSIFECFGNKVAQFLAFGKDGAEFVYGDYLVKDLGIFAFAVLTTIYFFGLCISVCYYIGAMQWVLFKLGWILQSILGTTVCESVNAAGNIFLGMSESPLVIKPFIKVLTLSEIHAIMVSGFSTVSGSTMVAYIAFKADPAHLITASVMAAPASLFFAKLVFPETEESQTSSSNIQLEKSPDSSILDAASNGASQAIPLVLNIIANLVAFVAFIKFADAIIQWLAILAGFEQVNIEFLLGKIFMPVSWLIGVDWKDCDKVGSVIGTKTIINEFVAFKRLQDFKEAKLISDRSSAIATFAICSFANPASIGIMIGGLSALAPERRPAVTKVAIRALIAACLVTLVTASIAGLLLTDEMIEG